MCMIEKSMCFIHKLLKCQKVVFFDSFGTPLKYIIRVMVKHVIRQSIGIGYKIKHIIINILNNLMMKISKTYLSRDKLFGPGKVVQVVRKSTPIRLLHNHRNAEIPYRPLGDSLWPQLMIHSLTISLFHSSNVKMNSLKKVGAYNKRTG